MTDDELRTGWFGQHVADFDVYSRQKGHVYQLDWGRPGTSVYFHRYLIVGPVLFVTGDCGDAVYRWSRNLTWEWLAGLNLDYFAGKCQASEVGRDYKEWDQRKATAYVQSLIDDKAAEDYEAGLTATAVADKPDDWSSTLWDATQDKWHLEQWLLCNGEELLGFDWMEFFDMSCGSRTSSRCQAHLLGIKMAVEQRRKLHSLIETKLGGE